MNPVVASGQYSEICSVAQGCIQKSTRQAIESIFFCFSIWSFRRQKKIDSITFLPELISEYSLVAGFIAINLAAGLLRMKICDGLHRIFSKKKYFGAIYRIFKNKGKRIPFSRRWTSCLQFFFCFSANFRIFQEQLKIILPKWSVRSANRSYRK
jgi:hypothetical protein